MSAMTLSYREVELEFGIPAATLYALVSRKQIPHIRLGRRWVRFERSAILDWLERHKIDKDNAK